MLQINDLIGHPQAISCLKKFLSSQNIPHALLFSGPKGVGKSQFALAFAHELLKETNDTAIQKLTSGNHPDLRHYFPDGKTYMHSMQSMQQFIREVELPPFEAERKIVIIHDADRMLPSSANAILKTLEEPIINVTIILLSSHASSLLPTIASRCFTLPFFSLSEEAIISHLQSKHQKSEEEARTIALLSHGILSKADALANKFEDQLMHMAAKAAYLSIHRDYLNLQSTISEIEAFLGKENDADRPDLIEELLHAFFYWMRDVHLLKINGDPQTLFFRDKEEELKQCLAYPLPTLEEFALKIQTVERALKLHIKLSHCLEELLFD